MGNGFLDNLLDRRFPQYFGSYLVGSFGLVQFSEWVVDNYGVSEQWPKIVFTFLAVMIPAVAMFIYNHGRPGHDSWTKIEKVFIPINLIVALVAGGLIYNQSPSSNLAVLEANATETVRVVNELGESERRNIPAKAATRRIFISKFNNVDKNQDNEYLEHALGDLLSMDLQQDPRLFVRELLANHSSLNKYNAKITSELSVSVDQKLAREFHTDFFIRGSYRKEGADYLLEVDLHGTENGKKLKRISARSTNYFDAVDQATQSIRDYIYSSESANSESFVDLPASNLMTASDQALKAFTQGNYMAIILDNPEEALKLYQKAIKRDPNFAYAHQGLCGVAFRLNNNALSIQHSQDALTHSKTLPERQGFEIRYYNSLIKNNIGNAEVIVKMWNKLYPADIKPYRNLIFLNKVTNRIDESIKYCQQALDYGYQGEMLVEMAELLQMKGDNEGALTYYERYTKMYPQNASESIKLAELYTSQGGFEKAEQHLKKVAILRDDDPEIQMNLAQIYAATNQYERSLKTLDKALNISSSLADTQRVWLYRAMIHNNFGETDKALYFSDLRMESLLKKDSSFSTYVAYVNPPIRTIYVDGNRNDLWQQKVDAFLIRYESTYPELRHMLQLSPTTLESVPIDSAKTFVESARPFLEASNRGHIIPLTQSLILKREGKYNEAVEAYQTYLKTSGFVLPPLEADFAELLTMNKDFKQSKAIWDKVLKIEPNNPSYLVRYGEMLVAQNKKDEAEKMFIKSKDILKRANPAYKWYQRTIDNLSKIEAD